MNQEDRETLIEVKVDVKWLKSAMQTHFSEHSKVKLLALGSILAAMTALIIACV